MEHIWKLPLKQSGKSRGNQQADASPKRSLPAAFGTATEYLRRGGAHLYRVLFPRCPGEAAWLP